MPSGKATAESVQAEQILAHYPAAGHLVPVESPAAESGFSGAVILRFQGATGDFCLRGWPPNGPPPARILGLHRLLKTVFEQGVTQVPVPIAADDGTTLVSVGDRLWQLEPWMPGRADFREAPSETRLRDAMACLAEWHRTAAAFQPRSHERAWFLCKSDAPSPAVSERLELIRRWNRGLITRLRQQMSHAERTEFREVGEQILQLFDRHSPAAADQLHVACRLRFRLQPCLRDVWHDHVLFTGDRVTGLIDASACRSENVASDLARLLGSLVEDDRQAWETALDEYRKHHPLTLDELGLLQILDQSGVLLSGMTWLDRHYLQGQEFAQPERVINRLRIILGRILKMEDRGPSIEKISNLPRTDAPHPRP